MILQFYNNLIRCNCSVRCLQPGASFGQCNVFRGTLLLRYCKVLPSAQLLRLMAKTWRMTKSWINVQMSSLHRWCKPAWWLYPVVYMEALRWFLYMLTRIITLRLTPRLRLTCRDSTELCFPHSTRSLCHTQSKSQNTSLTTWSRAVPSSFSFRYSPSYEFWIQDVNPACKIRKKGFIHWEESWMCRVAYKLFNKLYSGCFFTLTRLQWMS